MTVTSLFPILSTRDLPRLVSFYENALGGEVAYRFEDAGRDVYVSVTIGGGSLGIGEDAALSEPDMPEPDMPEPDMPEPDMPESATSPDRFALWFYVDDVDAAFAAAVAAGAAVDQEPADAPWGERVARVRDVDGNVLNLGAEAAAGP